MPWRPLSTNGRTHERSLLRVGHGPPRRHHPPPGLRRGGPARDARPRPRGPYAGGVLRDRARGRRPGPRGAAPRGAGRAPGAGRAHLASGVSEEPELFTRLAALPLTVESCVLDGLQRDVSSDFTRKTTVIRLRGGGQQGVGEDVTYDGPDHDVLQAAGPPAGLEGEGTLGDFCARVEAADLWPQPPAREPSRRYRIWGFESAGLDLALRQNGLSLYEA